MVAMRIVRMFDGLAVMKLEEIDPRQRGWVGGLMFDKVVHQNRHPDPLAPVGMRKHERKEQQ